jgi:hypothetical protein
VEEGIEGSLGSWEEAGSQGSQKAAAVASCEEARAVPREGELLRLGVHPKEEVQAQEEGLVGEEELQGEVEVPRVEQEERQVEEEGRTWMEEGMAPLSWGERAEEEEGDWRAAQVFVSSLILMTTDDHPR